MTDHIGEIVIYTSRQGVEMAALILGPARGDGVYLHLFPPPHGAPDVIDHEWGVEQGPGLGEWRPRDQDS